LVELLGLEVQALQGKDTDLAVADVHNMLQMLGMLAVLGCLEF